MELNTQNGFFLQDVYDYDFTQCLYELFKRLGYRIDGIDLSTKFNRNKSIGLIIRKYPEIGNRCRKLVNSTISQYLMRNNLSEREIIIVQFDGFISTREIKEINLFMPLIIKSCFKKFIISFQGNSFIALDENNEIHIKGVSEKINGMEKYFKRLLMINSYNKKGFFNSIEQFKNDFLSENNLEVFSIPYDNESYKFYIDYDDSIIIKKNALKFMIVENLNREKYFKIYFLPFIQSLIYHMFKK